MERLASLYLAVAAMLAGSGIPATVANAQDAGATQPSRMNLARIVCGADGETRFENVAVDLRRMDAAPPAPPLYVGGLQQLSRLTFAGFDPGWGSQDREAGTPHPAPVAQTVIILSGSFVITTTNGETRRFQPGDVLRVEDTPPCKGHITVAGDMATLVALLR